MPKFVLNCKINNLIVLDMDAMICRDYIEQFFPRLHLLYQNAVHWDVIVKTKSRIFYAHRIVLAGMYFAYMSVPCLFCAGKSSAHVF